MSIMLPIAAMIVVGLFVYDEKAQPGTQPGNAAATTIGRTAAEIDFPRAGAQADCRAHIADDLGELTDGLPHADIADLMRMTDIEFVDLALGAGVACREIDERVLAEMIVETRRMWRPFPARAGN